MRCRHRTSSRNCLAEFSLVRMRDIIVETVWAILAEIREGIAKLNMLLKSGLKPASRLTLLLPTDGRFASVK